MHSNQSNLYIMYIMNLTHILYSLLYHFMHTEDIYNVIIENMSKY